MQSHPDNTANSRHHNDNGASWKKNCLQRAMGMVKDRSSICMAKSRLEIAVVKATNHDGSSLDHKSMEYIFTSARNSPCTCLPTILPLISRRLRRTRSWIVALKGLIVTHGLLHICSPSNHHHHLPFDLSHFHDASSPPAFSDFVQVYYAFLSHMWSSTSNSTRVRGLQTMEGELQLMVSPPPILEAIAAWSSRS